MSRITTIKRVQLLTAATAMAVTGILAAAPSPQAGAAPCKQWGFDGPFNARGDNGWTVSFTAAPSDEWGSSSYVGDAVVIFDDGGQQKGTPSWSPTVRSNNVHIEIVWDSGKDNDRWVFEGFVSDDGLVHDGVEYLRTPGNMPSKWHSTTSLRCVSAPPAPAAPAPAPPAPAPPAPAPAPAPQANPAATVISDVDVYDAPGGSGNVVGILRGGKTVQLLDSCKPDDWCQVSGNDVPGAKGWVWGHLTLTGGGAGGGGHQGGAGVP